MKWVDNMPLWAKSLLGGLAVTGLLTPFIFYFWIFGPLSGYNLARNDDTWANFGSFIGGTVGPIISCLAFAGIFATYRLQNKQLQQANDLRRSEDIQRLITATAERMESRLKIPIDVLSLVSAANHSGEKYDLETVVTYVHGLTKRPDHKLKDSVPKIIKSISLELTQLAVDAENLSWLLEQQESIFGEKIITHFYYFRFGPTLESMFKIGIELQTITLDVFKLTEEGVAD